MWDDASQVDEVHYGSGGSEPVRDLIFDDLGRLTNDTLTDTGSSVTASYTYGYDVDGNPTDVVVNLAGNPDSGPHSYVYDRAGRLTEWIDPAATVTTVGWDDSGNRTAFGTDSYAYDERNRLITGPSGSYSYTPRGTLDSAGSTAYGFDALARLIDYNSVVGFTYDGLDRVAVRDAAVFEYAGTLIDPASDGTFSYARSPGGRLVSESDGFTPELVGLSRHGDLSYVFGTTGTVNGTRVFDPFGQITSSTGSFSSNLGFQADFLDPASGETWMGARWYSSADAVSSGWRIALMR